MIETRHLTKRYGATAALDDVSFTVPKGQVLGLLGLNGAGKSTTMNIIAGCLAPTEGQVLVAGVDMAREPAKAKRHIGYLPEIPPLYVDMKVGEFLTFVHGLKKLKGDRKAAVSAAAERAGVGHVLGRLIRNLSKGYRQRVGLAAALLGDPEVLILDEPTVGLDPTQIIEIRNLIAQLGRERTVILSSHILTEVQSVCERVIVLDRGRVVADDMPQRLEQSMRGGCLSLLVEGAPEAVLPVLEAVPAIGAVRCLDQREDGVWAYEAQGREGADIRRDLFFALSGAGLPLLASHGAGATLEEVFLRLVDHGPDPKGGEPL